MRMGRKSLAPIDMTHRFHHVQAIIYHKRKEMHVVLGKIRLLGTRYAGFVVLAKALHEFGPSCKELDP